MKNLSRIIIIVVTLLFQMVAARKVCQFQYTGTLDSLKGNTLNLPKETVAMQQEVILESFIDEIEESKPVSLFIIMDQTASMDVQDPDGNRHKALTKILDAIEQKSPNSEIGGVFFGNDLGLDTADDQLFVSSSHSSKGYGYIPFLKINENYESDNNGNAHGIDHFRYFFQLVDGSVNDLEWAVNHGPGADTSWQYFFNYTNIDAPFLAAREAFQNASNPSQDHYIIFFSDGGDNCGSTQFTTGEMTPSTFSVFFTSTINPTLNVIPKELDTMTTNIKNNGYSSSNVFSEIWAVNSEDDVMAKVDSAILEVVIKNMTVTPDTIKINGVTSVGSWDSSGLSLEEPVPLIQIPDTFTQILSYERIEIVNSDTATEQVIDTTEFYINRLDSNHSINVLTTWWDRELVFYNNSNYSLDIDSIGDSIGILFTQRDIDAGFKYDSVSVLITTLSGDTEFVNLGTTNDSFSILLPLSFTSKNSFNNTLEIFNLDTVIIFYKNPKLPLDTLSTKLILNRPDEVLADASLSASPGDTVYQTKYLEVLLETDSGNLIIYEVLNMDSTVISGPDTIITSGTVKVSGDVIITATATGVNLNSKDSSWAYNCELPDAKLIAIPGDAVYNSLSLDIVLETDSENNIIYEILNLDSAIISGPDTIGCKGTVNISGDVIVKAVAFGENYNSKDSSWIYDCELPKLVIKSSVPNGSEFTLDTTIFLTTFNENEVVPSDIYYLISYFGTGTIPDSLNGILYDSSVGITINNNATVYAIAYNKNFVSAKGVWQYNLKLLDIKITVNPSADPYFGIGYELDSIKIECQPLEGVTVTWIVSVDSIADSTIIESEGSIWDGLNFPSITTDEENEFYYLSVMAIGDGYNTTINVYKYKKQKLPDITASHYNENGYKFINNISVSLEAIDSLGIFENIEIHYFMDTIAFGLQAQGSDSGYQNPVILNIDTTIYIKAVATADNAINSDHFIGYYILETSVNRAWYTDKTAGGYSDTVDGLIDGVTIDLNNSVAFLPDSVLLISPFDTTEKIIVLNNNIAFDSFSNSRLLISIPRAFDSNKKNNSTKIDTSKTPRLGALYGQYYNEEAFTIRDSLKPLINYAIFYPGNYEINSESIIVNPDTILISFSEKVHIPGISLGEVRPASLFSTEEQVNYGLTLSFISVNDEGSEFRFLIDNISNSIIPDKGDSIRIDIIAEVSDILGNTQNIKSNRYGLIKDVRLRKYPFMIKAISPVTPSEFVIPIEIKEQGIYANGIDNGLMIIADFYTLVNTELMINAEAAIFDQVGNLIASINNYGFNENIAIDLVTINGNKNKTMIVLLWDGTNLNGRMAASGGYIAQFSFTDPSGNRISEKIPIAIISKN